MKNFVIKPAVRTENVTYAVRDIVVLANQIAKTGKEMLYLNIGDPNLFDWEPPKHLVEETYKAMMKNLNGYAPSSGIKQAIDAISQEAEKKGIKNVQDIFVTTGASEAIDICLTALVNEGENVLTPTPGYPLYTAIQSKLQMYENPYYLDETNGWQPSIDDIKSKINDKTRAIILINPNNPTGSNFSKETLQEIVDLANFKRSFVFPPATRFKNVFILIYYPKDLSGKKIQIKAYSNDNKFLKTGPLRDVNAKIVFISFIPGGGGYSLILIRQLQVRLSLTILPNNHLIVNLALY